MKCKEYVHVHAAAFCNVVSVVPYVMSMFVVPYVMSMFVVPYVMSMFVVPYVMSMFVVPYVMSMFVVPYVMSMYIQTCMQLPFVVFTDCLCCLLSVVSGVDDILPIMSYVIIRSGMPQLVSETALMDDFIQDG